MKNNNHEYGRERRLVYFEGQRSLETQGQRQQDPNAQFYAAYQKYREYENTGEVPSVILEQYKQALEEVIPHYASRLDWPLAHARYVDYKKLFGRNPGLEENLAKGGETVKELDRRAREQNPEEYLHEVVQGLPFAVIKTSNGLRLYTTSSLLYPLSDGVQKNAKEWWKMNPLIAVEIDMKSDRIRNVSIHSERRQEEWKETRIQKVVNTFSQGGDVNTQGSSLRETLDNLAHRLREAFEWQFASYEETKKTPEEHKTEWLQRFDRLVTQHERMKELLKRAQAYKHRSNDAGFQETYKTLETRERRTANVLALGTEDHEEQIPNIPELRSSLFQKDIDEVIDLTEHYLCGFIVEDCKKARENVRTLPLKFDAKYVHQGTARKDEKVVIVPVYDKKDFQKAPEQYGYTIYLERLLKNKGIDNEVQKAVLWDACSAISMNLYRLEQAMGHAYQDTRTHDIAREMLIDEHKRFAQILANINGQNPEMMHIGESMAGLQARDAITLMMPDDIYNWVKQMGDAVNDRGIFKTGEDHLFFQSCGQAIADRLAILHNEKKLSTEEYQQRCLQFGQLFCATGGREISPTARYTSDFDTPKGPRKNLSRVGNSAIAGHFLEEAIGYQNLAYNYYQRELQNQHPFASDMQHWSGEVKPTLQKQLAEKGIEYENLVQENKHFKRMVDVMETEPKSLEEAVAQYTIFLQLEAMCQQGTIIDPSAINMKIQGKLQPYLTNAKGKFEEFLDGTWKQGAPGVEKIEQVSGISFSPLQRQAFAILADMRGYGYDLSDETVQIASQVAIMISVGVVVGMVTGGLGLGAVASSLAIGATLTGVQYTMDNFRFKTAKEAFDYYGEQFLLNAAGADLGYILRSGRYALQLGRVTKESAPRIFATCMRGRGMATMAKYYDEALTLGQRLTGLTVEATANVGLNSILNTAICGGEFTDHLKRNAFFFGLPFGLEFAPSFLRSLAGSASRTQLQKLHSFAAKSRPTIEKFDRLCKKNRLNPQELLGTTEPDWSNALRGIPKQEAQEIKNIYTEMRRLQEQWSKLIDDATRRGPHTEPHGEFERTDGQGSPLAEPRPAAPAPFNPEIAVTGTGGGGGSGGRSPVERTPYQPRSGDKVGIEAGKVKDSSGKDIPTGSYTIQADSSSTGEQITVSLLDRHGRQYLLTGADVLRNNGVRPLNVTRGGWRSGDYIRVPESSRALPQGTCGKICRVRQREGSWYLEYREGNKTMSHQVGEDALPQRGSQTESQDALAIAFTGREIPKAPKAPRNTLVQSPPPAQKAAPPAQPQQKQQPPNTPAQLQKAPAQTPRPALEISTPIIAPEHSGKLHTAIGDCYRQYGEVFLVMRARNGTEIRVRHRPELQIAATRLKTIDDPMQPGRKTQVIAYQNEAIDSLPNSPEREYISEQYIVRVEAPDGTVIYDAKTHFGKPAKKT